jgi:hypothetical protein
MLTASRFDPTDIHFVATDNNVVRAEPFFDSIEACFDSIAGRFVLIEAAPR